MPKFTTQNIYSASTSESAGQLCMSYVCWGLAAILFIMVIASQVMTISVIVDYEETQTFTQHNCTNVSDYRIEKWDMFCYRAVANAIDITTGQNTTLYYPPIDVWIPWRHSSGEKWYRNLANLSVPFSCYIDYPKQIGTTGYLSSINIYYIVCGMSFIILLVSICIGCRYRTYRERRNGYYQLN